MYNTTHGIVSNTVQAQEQLHRFSLLQWIYSMASFAALNLYRALGGFFKHCLTQHLIPNELFYFFFTCRSIPPVLQLGMKDDTNTEGM